MSAYLNVDMYIVSMSGVHESAGIGSPETRALDCCELSCVWWETNTAPQEKEKVLLSSELSGYLLHIFLILFY